MRRSRTRLPPHQLQTDPAIPSAPVEETTGFSAMTGISILLRHLGRRFSS